MGPRGSVPPVERSRARLRLALLVAVLVLAGGGLVAWLVARDEHVQGGDPAEPAARVAVAPPLAAPPRRATPEAVAPSAPTPTREEEDAAAWAEPTDPAERPPAWPDVRTLRLRVEAVDAVTGAPLDVRWMAVVSHPARAGYLLAGHGVPMDERWRRSRDVAAVAVSGTLVDVGVVLYPVPRGYEAPITSVPRSVAVEPSTTDLVMRVPLAPTATLDLTVLGPDGTPAVGATVALVTAHPEYAVFPRADERADAQGRLRISEIPAIPGERVSVWLRWAGPAGTPVAARARPEPPPAPTETEEVHGDAPQLVTSVPDDGRRSWSATVRLAGPTAADVALGDHNETDNDLPTEESLGEEAPPRARLVVRARTVDGTPWAGADVRGAGILEATTDAYGAVAAEVVAGKVRVTASGSGYLPAAAEVVVEAGEETTVDLVEPRGARLTAVVVDERGVPLPFAHVGVDGAIVAAERGLQRIDERADVDGRRTWPRVEPGRRVVRARHGSRSAQATVDAPDGASVEVRLVLGRR